MNDYSTIFTTEAKSLITRLMTGVLLNFSKNEHIPVILCRLSPLPANIREVPMTRYHNLLKTKFKINEPRPGGRLVDGE